MNKKPTIYDRDQHELICKALKLSPRPEDPGESAYEGVCFLMQKIESALAQKSLRETRRALKQKNKDVPFLKLYGTET